MKRRDFCFERVPLLLRGKGKGKRGNDVCEEGGELGTEGGDEGKAMDSRQTPFPSAVPKSNPEGSRHKVMV